MYVHTAASGCVAVCKIMCVSIGACLVVYMDVCEQVHMLVRVHWSFCESDGVSVLVCVCVLLCVRDRARVISLVFACVCVFVYAGVWLLMRVQVCMCVRVRLRARSVLMSVCVLALCDACVRNGVCVYVSVCMLDRMAALVYVLASSCAFESVCFCWALVCMYVCSCVCVFECAKDRVCVCASV